MDSGQFGAFVRAMLLGDDEKCITQFNSDPKNNFLLKDQFYLSKSSIEFS